MQTRSEHRFRDFSDSGIVFQSLKLRDRFVLPRSLARDCDFSKRLVIQLLQYMIFFFIDLYLRTIPNLRIT